MSLRKRPSFGKNTENTKNLLPANYFVTKSFVYKHTIQCNKCIMSLDSIMMFVNSRFKNNSRHKNDNETQKQL